VDTLAHIPRELLFPAPGDEEDTVVLGYDENGHCPLVVNGLCSIYEHRPRTCRVYDCRVFAATGITPDKPKIAARAGRWAFDEPGIESAAVRAAAAYLNDHDLPAGIVPCGPTQTAVAAIRIHRLFLGDEPTPSDVERALRAIPGDG
jgi:hypothetical protein